MFSSDVDLYGFVLHFQLQLIAQHREYTALVAKVMLADMPSFKPTPPASFITTEAPKRNRDSEHNFHPKAYQGFAHESGHIILPSNVFLVEVFFFRLSLIYSYSARARLQLSLHGYAATTGMCFSSKRMFKVGLTSLKRLETLAGKWHRLVTHTFAY